MGIGQVFLSEVCPGSIEAADVQMVQTVVRTFVNESLSTNPQSIPPDRSDRAAVTALRLGVPRCSYKPKEGGLELYFAMCHHPRTKMSFHYLSSTYGRNTALLSGHESSLESS